MYHPDDTYTCLRSRIWPSLQPICGRRMSRRTTSMPLLLNGVLRIE